MPSRRRHLPFVAAFLAIAVAFGLVLGRLPGSTIRNEATARTSDGPLAPTGDVPPLPLVPYGNDEAPTPPMGWNGYNHFRLDVTSSLVKAMAQALVTSGMKSLGYDYVNLDGGWDLRQRAANGSLQPDPRKFPQGIKPLVAYVHSLGLKFGIYTSAGYRNCADTSAGSYGHYQQDARTFASWGVDYVKLDWCYMPFRKYPRMTRIAVSARLAASFGEALIATGRRIVFDVNDASDRTAAGWAPSLATLWRTAPDIRDTYRSMVANFMDDVVHHNVAGPGHWNDPDMLEVGNPGMSFNEQRTQFSLWAELAAPLIAGNDLTDMSRETQSILTNRAVIAVDQDPLGAQGYPVADGNGHWVLTKPLSDGDRAVVLFDQGSKPATISTGIAAIGLSGAPGYELRNLWSGSIVTATTSISVVVPAHGVVMYLVSPIV